MRTVAVAAALTLTCLATVVTPLIARADSLRCGSKIASEGSTQAEVLLRCGEPMTKLTRYETISEETRTQNQTKDKTSGASQAQVRTFTRTIDEWVYNFGPSEFMQEVTFVDGRLLKVRSLTYGTDGSGR